MPQSLIAKKHNRQLPFICADYMLTYKTIGDNETQLGTTSYMK